MEFLIGAIGRLGQAWRLVLTKRCDNAEQVVRSGHAWRILRDPPGIVERYCQGSEREVAGCFHDLVDSRRKASIGAVVCITKINPNRQTAS